MATLKDLLFDLKQADTNCLVSIYNPSGMSVPSHFHITEIGRTIKTFVDCGGYERENSNTTFQVWVADDVDHRMTVGKFLDIIAAGKNIINQDDEVIFEYDNNHTIGLYGVALIQRLEHFFNIFLMQKRTNCLAPDKCGVKSQSESCCGSKGCC